MIVTLTGSNEFLLRETLRQLVAQFIETNGEISVENLDCETNSFDQINESLHSLPFLSLRKMIVIRQPSFSPQLSQAAENLLATLPESTDLILIEPALDKRSSFYKLLKKTTDFREFSNLDEMALTDWLVLSAAQQGAKLSTADARFLINRVGLDQRLLDNELRKLILYDQVISRKNIEFLIDLTPQSKIFELLDAAFRGDLANSLRLYADQRQQRVEPKQIIAMLAWQIRIFALLKTSLNRSDEIIAQETKIKPFVVSKSRGAVKNISLDRLKKLVADLLTIDARSKREKIDLDEALQLFFVKIVA